MRIPLTPIRFLDRARRQFARKIGVVDGDRSWTYLEYDRTCRRLANLLLSWGLPKSSPAAFLAYNSHHLLEGYYGVPLAGGVLLPLNIRLSASDFRFILNDSGASALFFHSDFLETVESIRKDLGSVTRFVVLDEAPVPDWAEPQPYEDLLEGQSANLDLDVMQVDEDAVCELFYTSGTTGDPKGVMLTHRNLYLHALEASIAMGGAHSDVQLHTIPLFHVNGWGTPQFLTCIGGRHVMVHGFEPIEIFETIERQRVTIFSLVPTMATTLVNHAQRHRFDFSSVRAVLLGGAAANPHLIRVVEDVFGCTCTAGYGLTETSPVLTLAHLKDDLELTEEGRRERQAMTGYPIPGVELEIWDEDGKVLPWDGQSVGEIVVRGDMVMEGYLNRPEETDQAFRGGWFHTGDMATIDADGYVLIVDRFKDIIISGGENISSLEVERVLLGHPAVLECAVIAVPDSRWGEVPRALIVLKDGASASEDELLSHAREELAHFKAPRGVSFYESFPKGGTGKILKRELREDFWTGQKKRVH